MGKGHMKAALQLAGSQHRYQTMIIIILSASWIVVNLMFLSPTYVFMQPVFQCQKNPKYKFHEVEACKMLDQCKLTDDFTLTAKMGLYCDLNSARVIIQSIFPIGSFLGLIIVNLLSDTRGRKFAFQITLSISLVGTLLLLHGGTSNSIFSLIVGQFVLGFGSYSILPLGYTIIFDFFSDSFRPVAVIIVNAVGGFSTFSIGIFYLMQLKWINFLLLFVLIPLIILLLTVCIFLQESPYILMNRNKQQEALQVLQNIARFNGKADEIQDIRRIIEAESVRDEQNQANLQNVFKKVKQWKYLKSIILITIIYGIFNLNFFGISYSYEEEGFGFGFNSMLSGFVEMAAFLFLKWTVKKIPRKVGIAFFYALVSIIGLCFMTETVKENVFLSTLFLGLSKLSSTNAYCLIACMETEAFSVSIQSTATGLIEAFALYGALIAPLIVDIALKIGIDPISMVAFFVSFGILPVYFLRETFQKSNPQTRGPLFQHLKDYNKEEMTDLTDLTSVSDS